MYTYIYSYISYHVIIRYLNNYVTLVFTFFIPLSKFRLISNTNKQTNKYLNNQLFKQTFKNSAKGSKIL